MEQEPRRLGPAILSGRELVDTLQDLTRLVGELRRQQLEAEAYGTVTRLALGALLRASPPEARAAVAARLREGTVALLGPDVAPDSLLAVAVAEEAARMAAALVPDAPRAG